MPSLPLHLLDLASPPYISSKLTNHPSSTNPSVHFHASSLSLLTTPEILSPHVTAAASSLSGDSTGRYLLSSSADATVAIYDLNPTGEGITKPVPFPDDGVPRSELQLYADKVRWSGKGARQRKPLSCSKRVSSSSSSSSNSLSASPAGHSYSVTTSRWFPGDNGMFLTADRGGTALIWDTNRFLPVCAFPAQASATASSATASSLETYGLTDCAFPPLSSSGSKTQFAATTTSGHLKLFDILSPPSPVLSISSSKTSSTSVSYHPHCEHLVAVTGGIGSGTVSFFDLRRSGASCYLTSCQSSNMSDLAEQSSFSAPVPIQHAPSDTRHLEAADLLPAHQSGAAGSAFTPCGNFLLTLSCASEISLWDLRGAVRSSNGTVDCGVSNGTMVVAEGGGYSGSAYSGSAVASREADWSKPVLLDVDRECFEEEQLGGGGGGGSGSGGALSGRRGKNGTSRIDLTVVDPGGRGRLSDLGYVTPMTEKGGSVVHRGRVFCETGEKTVKLRGHLSAVTACTSLADGSLVSGSEDGMVLAWGYADRSDVRGPRRGGEVHVDVDNW